MGVPQSSFGINGTLSFTEVFGPLSQGSLAKGVHLMIAGDGSSDVLQAQAFGFRNRPVAHGSPSLAVFQANAYIQTQPYRFAIQDGITAVYYIPLLWYDLCNEIRYIGVFGVTDTAGNMDGAISLEVDIPRGPCTPSFWEQQQQSRRRSESARRRAANPPKPKCVPICPPGEQGGGSSGGGDAGHPPPPPPPAAEPLHPAYAAPFDPAGRVTGSRLGWTSPSRETSRVTGRSSRG